MSVQLVLFIGVEGHGGWLWNLVIYSQFSSSVTKSGFDTIWYNTMLTACILWLFNVFHILRDVFKVLAHKMSAMIFLICSYINMFAKCQQIKKGELFFLTQTFLLRVVILLSPKSSFSLIDYAEVYGFEVSSPLVQTQTSVKYGCDICHSPVPWIRKTCIFLIASIHFTHQFS